MGIRTKNNAYSRLAASVAVSDTFMTVEAGTGVRFPILEAGDFTFATLIGANGSMEIVKVTGRNTDTMTIERAQEGTTALDWSVGARVECRFTAGMYDMALEAANIVTDLSVSATGLPYGSDPTVTYSTEDRAIAFGIPQGPQGEKGDTGDTGPQGPQGEKGDTGGDGVGITSISLLSGTHAPGTTDTYRITLTDGSTQDFTVYNGADGSGSGDMSKSIYDPTNKNADAFDYNNFTNTPTIPTVPTVVSAFTNDAGYVTSDGVPTVSNTYSATSTDAMSGVAVAQAIAAALTLTEVENEAGGTTLIIGGE